MSSVSASVCASAPRTDPPSATLVAAPVLPALVPLLVLERSGHGRLPHRFVSGRGLDRRWHAARVDLRALLGRVDLGGAAGIRRDVADDVGAPAALVEVGRELLGDRPGRE